MCYVFYINAKFLSNYLHKGCFDSLSHIYGTGHQIDRAVRIADDAGGTERL